MRAGSPREAIGAALPGLHACPAHATRGCERPGSSRLPPARPVSAAQREERAARARSPGPPTRAPFPREPAAGSAHHARAEKRVSRRAACLPVPACGRPSAPACGFCSPRVLGVLGVAGVLLGLGGSLGGAGSAMPC